MMKKSLGLVLTFIITFSYCQKFGVNVGFGASNLVSVDKGINGILPDYKYSLAYSSDFNWWGRISDKVSIVTGLGFTSISTAYENPINIKGQEGRETLNLYYVKLPIRCTFVLNNFVSFIGPSLGYKIHEAVKDPLYYYHTYGSKFSYGLDIGLGIKITPSIITGISTHYGLSNIDENECGNCSSYQAEVSRIRSFELNFNYIITDRK